MSDTPEAPKIEFPCEDYPIKVVGFNDEKFQPYVVEVLQHFNTEFDENSVTLSPSKNGTYISLTVRITAQSVQHLKNLNEKLRASQLVKLVL